MTVFRASQDRLVTGITAAVVVLLAGMAIGFAALALSGSRPGWHRALFAGVVAVCAGILGFGWGWHPAGYALAGDAVLVLRPVGNLTLPLAEVTAVRQDPTPFAGAVRVAGNGGLFGFWGRFHSERMHGTFTAWATRRDRGVVLDVAGRPVVLTPDEPARMASAIAERLAGAPVGEGMR